MEKLLLLAGLAFGAAVARPAPARSSNNIGPASEANKAGFVYITGGGTDPGLTARGLKNFFHSNNISGYAMAVAGLIGELGVKSVSILYSTKDAPTDLARDPVHRERSNGRRAAAVKAEAAQTSRLRRL